MKESMVGQHSERLEKRRKANRMLNIAIAVVVILIVVFGYRILTNTPEEDNLTQAESPETPTDNVVNEPTENSGNQDNVNEGNTNVSNPVQETTEPSERVIVPTDEPDVIEAFVDPSWTPIGTVQSEPHTIQFNTEHQDWREMVQAAAYATGLVEEDFIVWRIGNGGANNRAIATIGTHDNSYRYRIYIEWVTNEGWKPTLVKRLRT